jgi:threonyl-tRNA synthetase
VLDKSGVDYQAEKGEAAFYGPKIDVQVADHADREATMSTVQIDFYQPARFDLSYVGADGQRHRPVMVHRSIVGTVERAVAVLIEQHGGAFPAWLAPVQVLVLPVSDAEDDAARAVAGRCLAAGLRVRVAAEGSLGSRIRDGRLVPYVAVIGAAEAREGTVALRLRGGQQAGSLPAAEMVSRIGELVHAYSINLW